MDKSYIGIGLGVIALIVAVIALVLSAISSSEQGPVGEKGPVGPQGPKGDSSTNTILNGEGAPSNSLGNNGDYYIDNNESNLYGPKLEETGVTNYWENPTGPVSLVGPQGVQGIQGEQGPPGIVNASSASISTISLSGRWNFVGSQYLYITRSPYTSGTPGVMHTTDSDNVLYDGKNFYFIYIGDEPKFMRLEYSLRAQRGSTNCGSSTCGTIQGHYVKFYHNDKPVEFSVSGGGGDIGFTLLSIDETLPNLNNYTYILMQKGDTCGVKLMRSSNDGSGSTTSENIEFISNSHVSLYSP